MSGTPTFNTWDRLTLDRFAMDAYLRLQQQEDQLEQLRGDLKDAIAAYRHETLRNASYGNGTNFTNVD